MSTKKLNVDLDEVVDAMEQGGEVMLDMSWHLDTQTGKVLMIGGDLSFDADDPPDEFPDDASDREKWFEYEQASKREWAEEWLGELGIESTWSPPVVNQKAADWQPKVIGIHHVQITVPVGQEQAARDFYCKVMGFREIEKPKAL